ncbi:MAG: glutamate racemase [Parvibaculaceae bacterium]
MNKPRILLFDSGMGGLTVARAVRAAEPEAILLYAADNAAFPYGAWDEDALVKRIVAVVGRLIDRTKPDLVVIACNTASTLALAALRERYTVPFVGTVPAIKPAAAQTKSGMIGVLATPGTVNREYTRTLIHTYAYHCKVFLHGARRLAEIAEAKLRGNQINLDELRNEIMPVFRKRDGKTTDVIVLGCTHYPLLLDDIRAIEPWPVTYIDPAPAIARRVSDLLRSNGTAGSEHGDSGTLFLTSQRGKATETLLAYAAMGFANNEVIDLPV